MLVRERQLAAVHELLDPHKPPDSFVPSQKELSTLMASGDPKAMILAVGAERLYLEDVTRLVMQSGEAQAKPPLELAREVIEERYRQEVASQLGAEAGLDRSKAYLDRYAPLEERALAEFQLKRQLQAEVDAAVLDRFFEETRQRYSEPMLVRAKVLSVPLGPTAPRYMADLERARDDLDSGRTSLEDLARRFGGEVEDLGWRTLDQLGQASPGLPYWAVELPAEKHSPPFR